jgi:hypothetical protein
MYTNTNAKTTFAMVSDKPPKVQNNWLTVDLPVREFPGEFPFLSCAHSYITLSKDKSNLNFNFCR